MNNSYDCAPQDVEALIRAAGNYVHPSDDLRPLVLEEARLERSERRAQERIWQLVLAIVLVTLLLSTWRNHSASALDAAGGFDAAVPASASSLSPPRDNPTWHTVDSFSELRRRQAALLKLAM